MLAKHMLIAISFVNPALLQGASLSFEGRHEEAVKAAVAAFVEKETRPEAAIVAAVRYRLEQGKEEPVVSCPFLAH